LETDARIHWYKNLFVDGHYLKRTGVPVAVPSTRRLSRQLQDKIVVPFALTIYPYSLGGIEGMLATD
jgi:hypothetical protein